MHRGLQVWRTDLVRGLCAGGVQVQVENGSGGEAQTDATCRWVHGAAVPPSSLGWTRALALWAAQPRSGL